MADKDPITVPSSNLVHIPKIRSGNPRVRLNDFGRVDTEDVDYATSLILAGFPLQSSRPRGKDPKASGGKIIFEFSPEDLSELPGIGVLSMTEVHEMWIMGAPAIPIPNIRLLPTARAILNYHIWEVHRNK